MSANNVLAHITCDIANVREKMFGRGLIKYCSRITIFMTNELIEFLWNKVRGVYAIGEIPENLMFYGYPVKRIDEAGIKYWISVENGEFHKEDLEND